MMLSAHQMMELAVTNIQPAVLTQETMSACNNAAWSLGEIAIKVSRPTQEHQSLFKPLSPLHPRAALRTGRLLSLNVLSEALKGLSESFTWGVM